MKWIFLSIAIVTEVIATAALRSCAGFTRLWPSILVVIGYAVSFYFVSLTLKTIPVGIAYAIWSGVGMVLIILIGYFIFQQRLDWPALIGIFLILTGVVVINVFSGNVTG